MVANLPVKQTLTVDLWDVLPDTGVIRVRALLSRSTPENQSPPVLSLLFGHVVSTNSFASEKVGSGQEILSVPSGPQFYEWTFPLGEVVRNPFRKVENLKGPNPAEYIRFQNTSSTKEGVTLHYVEVTAPFHEQWPPDSHRKIFPAVTDGAKSVMDAREIILNFMEKAWRRPVSTEEVDRKLAIFYKFRKAEISFKNAIIETLATVLSSSNFLYLAQSDENKEGNTAENNRDFGLATRLSVFLWSSLPDEELLDLSLIHI